MNIEFLKNATPEQVNLWDYAKGLIAWTTITKLVYSGPITGSEFLTYNVGKLYIALDFVITMNSPNAIGLAAVPLMYVPGPVQSDAVFNVCCAWDVTAAVMKYIYNPVVKKNIYFSYFTDTTYKQLFFNGYRLNV